MAGSEFICFVFGHGGTTKDNLPLVLLDLLLSNFSLALTMSTASFVLIGDNEVREREKKIFFPFIWPYCALTVAEKRQR